MSFRADRCIIHFGLAKTGTTAIQETAFRQREQLLRYYAALYPGDVANHWHFQSLFSADPSKLIQIRRLNLSGSEVTDYLQRYKANFEGQVIQHKPRTILLSSEYLVSMSDAELLALRKYLDRFCRGVTWIAYVRDPWSFAFSHHYQLLRDGLARGAVRVGYSRSNVEILDRLSKIFGRPSAVRPYIGGSERTEDVVSDFFRAIGIFLSPGSEGSRPRNVSIGRAAASVLSYFNEVYPAVDESGAYRSDAGRDWCVERIVEAAQAVYQAPTISRTTAKLIYDQSKADITRLESEFFGEDVFTRHYLSLSYGDADDVISLERLSKRDLASILIEAMRRLSEQAAWDRGRAERAEARLHGQDSEATPPANATKEVPRTFE